MSVKPGENVECGYQHVFSPNIVGVNQVSCVELGGNADKTVI